MKTVNDCGTELSSYPYYSVVARQCVEPRRHHGHQHSLHDNGHHHRQTSPQTWQWVATILIGVHGFEKSLRGFFYLYCFLDS